ncbi:MAG TPA: MFS transporter, partial [Labilithrix sp.]|nr:MFS transporter [Labilithrix sp.]
VALVIALRGRAPVGRLDEEKPMRERLGELAQMARSPLFWALTLPVGFNKLTFSSLQGILPLYGARGLGLTTTRIALLFVLIGVCFGVAQPVGGALADRFAPRAVSIAFMPPMLLALLGMSMTRAFATFTIAFATYIFCSSLIFAATMKHTAAAFGTNDTYGGVSGIFATVTDLMTIVGPLLFLNIYGVADGAVFEWMAGVGVAFMGAFVLFGRDRGARNRLMIRP